MHLQRVGAHQDRASFAALFEHYSPLLKAFLLREGNVSDAVAEELVQETMIRVWSKAASYSSGRSSATTWIYTIARNTKIDWLRKRNRQVELVVDAEELYLDDTVDAPYVSLAALKSEATVSEKLRALPKEQADVLELMFTRGLSGQEAAKWLDVPLGTIKSRVRLALAKLKISLASTHGPQYSGEPKL